MAFVNCVADLDGNITQTTLRRYTIDTKTETLHLNVSRKSTVTKQIGFISVVCG